MPPPQYETREECILCCRSHDILGIGQCKHPACMECVIRMRCIGESIVCHACREDVPTMYFIQRPTTKAGQPIDWSTYPIPACDRPHPDAQKFNIAFENAHVARIYDQLNAFVCMICSRGASFAEFPTFAALKQHMGTHRKLYCHICLDNLNILPKHRHTFSSVGLEKHMTGKENVVMGVRGHPMCQFCHERFFDEEELYKHSRRQHFFCTLCSQTTGVNTFFNRIDQLHKHYRDKHHPCLDRDCVQMGIVFADELGLKLHKAEQHQSGTNRNVQIDYEFTRNNSRYGSPPRQRHDVAMGVAATAVPSPPSAPAAPPTIIPSAQFSGQPVHIVPPANAARRLEADFPSLPPSAPSSQAYAPSNVNWRADAQAARRQATTTTTNGGNARPRLEAALGSTSHFPTLGNSAGPSGVVAPANSVWSKSSDKIKKAIEAPTAKKTPVDPGATRKRLIPLPEAWPENMRRKLEAREAGLPEPPDLYPPLPSVPLEIAKRAKAAKKKTVSADTVKKMVAERSAPVTQSSASSAKFGALTAAEVPTGVEDGNTLDAWLSSSAIKAKQKKADKRKAEREAKEAEKARQAEEEQKKVQQERLTYAKFVQEREEAERKRLAQMKKEQQDEDYLMAYAYAMENGGSPPNALQPSCSSGSSSDNADPTLQLLMEQFNINNPAAKSKQTTNNTPHKKAARAPTSAQSVSSDSATATAGISNSPPPGFERLKRPG